MSVAEDLAWQDGNEAETMTGGLLASLPRSFVVLDGLVPLGSDASIEHLVIGPTGAFAVETETNDEGVTISRGRVRSGRLDRQDIVERAEAQAVSMSHMLAEPVRPLVVVQHGLRHGRLALPVVGAVRLCSPGQLVGLLSGGTPVLEAHEVVSLALRATDGCAPRGRAAAFAVA